MIFDKDYDASLWYILKLNKKNREDIAEFIKEIPEQLLDNIRISIKKLKKGIFEFDQQTSDFYRYISDKLPKVYYYFQIDENNCLTIAKMLYTGLDEIMIKIKLFPISLVQDKKIEIGTLVNNNSNENKYLIYNNSIGQLIRYNKEKINGVRHISTYKPININTIPEDITKEKILCKNYNKYIIKKH